MTSPHRKYMQFELFPSASPEPLAQQRTRLLIERVSFSLENLVIASIAVIIVMVLSFSFGVERGKRVVRQKPMAQPSVLPAADANMIQEATSPTDTPVSQAAALSQPQDILEESGKTIPGTISAQPEQSAPVEISVDKFYTVQVASYKKMTRAEKEAINLKDKGYETLVIPKGEYSIICIGKFALETQARDFSKKLKKQYKDCLVRRL